MQPDPDPTSDIPGMCIWGWTAPAELRWLMEQASEMDNAVEVGSLHGRSAFALLTACPGSVYCVDDWNDAGHESFMGSCGHFWNLAAIRAVSPGAASLVPDVDMVFLDGAHTYESVLADIAGWLPKTRRLLCGHDFIEGDDAGFPGVARAVRAVFGDRVEVAHDTAIWYVDVGRDRSVLPDAPAGVLEWRDEYGRDLRQEISWA